MNNHPHISVVSPEYRGEKMVHELVQKKAEERWGAGVVEQVSLDLQREFPNADGFSTTNLWYMKQWYLFYSQGDTKLQQFLEKIQI